ncbi:hypothetical protein [Oscillatoria salina]|uniref:hypothetical protein n=1 Tax=Oscillatoria salina TaxID=331517 RepID=UPI0013BD6DC5|nr:hypothetical protein [Oscillatoria salina]MBZ8180945.1 hypothetical protein [Oscillatoria salina IIICB1]NET87898.1 hypothetical protein [Kamptonema sp. SIO1D9]
MVSWSIEESDYQGTTGWSFDTSSSGYLQIQPNGGGSEPTAVPFLWWNARRSNYVHGFNWWEDYDFGTVQNSTNSLLENSRFIKFESDEVPDEIYYLVLPDLDTDFFINLASESLDIDSYDPSYESGFFDNILSREYSLNVEYSQPQLEITDFCQTIQCQVTPLPPDPTNTTVPEPSSTFSILGLAAIFFVIIIKRSLLPKRSKIFSSQR